MPKCRFDDWARWISSVGVLCLLGLPGMFFQDAKRAGEEPAVTPDTVPQDPPVAAPASEDQRKKDDDKGLDPHVIMAAVKHDQVVPRRPAGEDERPRVRPLSRRDTGTLNPDANSHDNHTSNHDTKPTVATLLTQQTQVVVRRLARSGRIYGHPPFDWIADPAIGTVVCAQAPPRV